MVSDLGSNRAARLYWLSFADTTLSLLQSTSCEHRRTSSNCPRILRRAEQQLIANLPPSQALRRCLRRPQGLRSAQVSELGAELENGQDGKTGSNTIDRTRCSRRVEGRGGGGRWNMQLLESYCRVAHWRRGRWREREAKERREVPDAPCMALRQLGALNPLHDLSTLDAIPAQPHSRAQ